MVLSHEITTERLLIRRFKSSDWKDLYEYLSDEKVVHFEPYETFSEEECMEEAVNRAQDEAFLAVCLKESGKLIGNLYFEKSDFGAYELGYVFNHNYWNNGYAGESAKALMDYAFNEWNIRRIIAMCNPENDRSWKLLERLGMRREGHLLKNIYFKTDDNNVPIWQDTYEYAILKSEWKNISK